MTRLVRSLNVNGTRIPYMMELVSALNSRIMGRIFELVVPVELRDRVCLLVMGSEGRREQLLKTEQDNALVLGDDLDWPGPPAAMDSFRAAPAQFGDPPCPGLERFAKSQWRMSGRPRHDTQHQW